MDFINPQSETTEKVIEVLNSIIEKKGELS